MKKIYLFHVYTVHQRKKISLSPNYLHADLLLNKIYCNKPFKKEIKIMNGRMELKLTFLLGTYVATLQAVIKTNFYFTKICWIMSINEIFALNYEFL